MLRQPNPWIICLPIIALLNLPVVSEDCTPASSVAMVEINDTDGISFLLSRSITSVPSWTYVVCHGMGGSTPGDRFHTLAQQILSVAPDAQVIQINWSPLARETFLGIPNPWKVSANLPRVAHKVIAFFRARRLDLNTTTMIGESFGNAILSDVAGSLGGVANFLAFNPASELGGRSLNSLWKIAKRSWSFHTRSEFDTQCRVASVDFLLTTKADNSYSKHVSGIPWLAEQLKAGRHEWLSMDLKILASEEHVFTQRVAEDGQIQPVRISRKPELNSSKSDQI